MKQPYRLVIARTRHDRKYKIYVYGRVRRGKKLEARYVTHPSQPHAGFTSRREAEFLYRKLVRSKSELKKGWRRARQLKAGTPFLLYQLDTIP